MYSDGPERDASAIRKRRAAVIMGILTTFANAPAEARPNTVRYACSANRDITVERTSSTARVELAGRTYDLHRERSSIGQKYLSQRAALIIDGASAIFVANDQLDLGACSRAVPIASAR